MSNVSAISKASRSIVHEPSKSIKSPLVIDETTNQQENAVYLIKALQHELKVHKEILHSLSTLTQKFQEENKQLKALNKRLISTVQQQNTLLADYGIPKVEANDLEAIADPVETLQTINDLKSRVAELLDYKEKYEQEENLRKDDILQLGEYKYMIEKLRQEIEQLKSEVEESSSQKSQHQDRKIKELQRNLKIEKTATCALQYRLAELKDHTKQNLRMKVKPTNQNALPSELTKTVYQQLIQDLKRDNITKTDQIRQLFEQIEESARENQLLRQAEENHDNADQPRLQPKFPIENANFELRISHGVMRTQVNAFRRTNKEFSSEKLRLNEELSFARGEISEKDKQLIHSSKKIDEMEHLLNLVSDKIPTQTYKRDIVSLHQSDASDRLSAKMAMMREQRKPWDDDSPMIQFNQPRRPPSSGYRSMGPTNSSGPLSHGPSTTGSYHQAATGPKSLSNLYGPRTGPFSPPMDSTAALSDMARAPGIMATGYRARGGDDDGMISLRERGEPTRRPLKTETFEMGGGVKPKIRSAPARGSGFTNNDLPTGVLNGNASRNIKSASTHAALVRNTESGANALRELECPICSVTYYSDQEREFYLHVDRCLQ